MFQIKKGVAIQSIEGIKHFVQCFVCGAKPVDIVSQGKKNWQRLIMSEKNVLTVGRPLCGLFPGPNPQGTHSGPSWGFEFAIQFGNLAIYLGLSPKGDAAKTRVGEAPRTEHRVRLWLWETF